LEKKAKDAKGTQTVLAQDRVSRRAPYLAALSDEELMFEVGRLNVEAYDVLVDRYHQQVYNFVKKNVFDEEIAHDITQEILLRVYKSAKSFDVSKKFSSWMYKIAVNEIRRHFKKTAQAKVVSINEPMQDGNNTAEKGDFISDDKPGPEQAVATELMQENIRKLIKLLPDKQRIVVTLKVYQGLTFEEIASILDCPLSTVLSRMRYAVKKLRDYFEPGVTDDEL
jgi:RNA polymerase sigma-70 factor (ECF subfamily)